MINICPNSWPHVHRRLCPVIEDKVSKYNFKVFKCFLVPAIRCKHQNSIVAWSAPSQYLNQCWNIVNWTLRNKLQWNLDRNSNITFKKMHLKVSSAKRRPFCLGLNVLIWPKSSYRDNDTRWDRTQKENVHGRDRHFYVINDVRFSLSLVQTP